MVIKHNEPMSTHTTLEIGGPAKIFITVETEQELLDTITKAKNGNKEFIVIGSGSNLLVSDEGYDGLVIENQIRGIKMEGGLLIVKSGTQLQEVVDLTIKHGLGGMSAMTGIPGTVGGAVYGSAGAYGDNIRDYLLSITYFDGKDIVTIPRKKYETGYRDSIFKRNKNLIILEVVFGNLPLVDKSILEKEAEEVLDKRSAKYPPETKCPGSFFKNVVPDNLDPETYKKVKNLISPFGKIPAGALIDAVGGRGHQYRQIKIAQNHGNTFVNLGGGTAGDFYALAKNYAGKVKEKFGIQLEPEVQLVNLPAISPSD